MKNFYFANLFIIIVFLLTACQIQSSESIESVKTLGIPGQPKIMSQLKLKSPAFLEQDHIPAKYTCDGYDVNINPPLQISDVPEGTQSMVLIVDDPDTPRGDWVHWLLWNIPAQTSQIAEDEVPAGSVQGKNNFGRNEYSGPCPPSGAHRYQFKLYALDSQLNLDSKARKKDLEKAMQGHILDQTLLVGLYKRE